MTQPIARLRYNTTSVKKKSKMADSDERDGRDDAAAEGKCPTEVTDDEEGQNEKNEAPTGGLCRRQRKNKKKMLGARTVPFTMSQLELFDRKQELIQDWKQNDENGLNEASLKKEIVKLNRQIKNCRDRKKRESLKQEHCDKVWSLEHLDETALREAILHTDPSLVSHVSRGRGDDGKEETWQVRVWLGESESAIVEVNEAFLGYVLSPEGIASGRYTTPELRAVLWDHRPGALEHEPLYRIRQVGPATFQAMTRDGKKATLSEEWVRVPTNVNPEAVEMAMAEYHDQGTSAETRWIEITEGKRRPTAETKITEGERLPSPAAGCNDIQRSSTLPLIQYTNGELDWDCTRNAFASALVLVGHKKEAETIAGAPIRPGIAAPQQLMQISQEFLGRYGLRVFRIKLHLFGSEASVRGPDEIFLLGLPNKHCVSIVGDLVLDPDSSHAEPVSQETMDKACGVLAPFTAPVWTLVITSRDREDRMKRRSRGSSRCRKAAKARKLFSIS